MASSIYEQWCLRTIVRDFDKAVKLWTFGGVRVPPLIAESEASILETSDLRPSRSIKCEKELKRNKDSEANVAPLMTDWEDYLLLLAYEELRVNYGYLKQIYKIDSPNTFTATQSAILKTAIFTRGDTKTPTTTSSLKSNAIILNVTIMSDSKTAIPEVTITTTTNTKIKIPATIIINRKTFEMPEVSSIPEDLLTAVDEAFLAGKDMELPIRTTHTKVNNNITQSPKVTRPEGKIANAASTGKRRPSLSQSLTANKGIRNQETQYIDWEERITPGSTWSAMSVVGVLVVNGYTRKKRRIS